jgi:hypothetical protein
MGALGGADWRQQDVRLEGGAENLPCRLCQAAWNQRIGMWRFHGVAG